MLAFVGDPIQPVPASPGQPGGLPGEPIWNRCTAWSSLAGNPQKVSSAPAKGAVWVSSETLKLRPKSESVRTETGIWIGMPRVGTTKAKQHGIVLSGHEPVERCGAEKEIWIAA